MRLAFTHDTSPSANLSSLVLCKAVASARFAALVDVLVEPGLIETMLGAKLPCHLARLRTETLPRRDVFPRPRLRAPFDGGAAGRDRAPSIGCTGYATPRLPS